MDWYEPGLSDLPEFNKTTLKYQNKTSGFNAETTGKKTPSSLEETVAKPASVTSGASSELPQISEDHKAENKAEGSEEESEGDDEEEESKGGDKKVSDSNKTQTEVEETEGEGDKEEEAEGDEAEDADDSA